MSTAQDKSLYESYVKRHDLPVFYQPWYLDAACREGEWFASMDIHEGEVRGVWPYLLKRKYGQNYITQPPLTSFLGPFCHRPADMTKESTWISHQKSILSNLFDRLPPHLLMISQWTPDQTNWLPLYWKECKQTTRYTYQIDLRQSVDTLWRAISTKQRNHIKQAQQSYHIASSDAVDDLWSLIEATYRRQRSKIPYTKALFTDLDLALRVNEKRKMFLVRAKDKIVAGVYLIYDKTTAYLLITGRADEDNSGGVALAIWEAIQYAKKIGLNIFDFEGSMMQGVESFFRSFGGRMMPYHRVTHTPGRLAELIFRILNRI